MPNKHVISLTEASALTLAFQQSAPRTQPIAGLFDLEAINLLLDQSNIAGVRYYFGQDRNGQQIIVLTAVDGSGNDIENGVLLDAADMGPPTSSRANSLNHY